MNSSTHDVSSDHCEDVPQSEKSQRDSKRETAPDAGDEHQRKEREGQRIPNRVGRKRSLETIRAKKHRLSNPQSSNERSGDDQERSKTRLARRDVDAL
jgi:hypothetical protein